MRIMRVRLYLLICLLFFMIGCVGVQNAKDRFEACKADPVCLAEMQQVKSSTYEVTKVASSSIPFPSIPETVAVIASNIAAFGFGILKGRKKAS